MITLVAALTFDELGWVVVTGVTYQAISAMEALVVTPMVLGRNLTLNPVVILMSLLFWGWLWGVPGALLAVPLLASLKIVFDHVEPLQPVGSFWGANRSRPRTWTCLKIVLRAGHFTLCAGTSV